MNTDKQIPKNIFSQLVQKFSKRHPGSKNIRIELEETVSSLDDI